MSALWAAWAAAFTLGTAHALEVDHMVAVTAFVGGNPRVGSAASFGIRWGIGHAFAVLIAGAVLAGSRLTVPPSAQRWTEGMVGLALVGVGVWAWRNARRLHLHDPRHHGDHAHLHAHGAAIESHEHSHGDSGDGRPHLPVTGQPHEHAGIDGRHTHVSTLVGAVHGLSGTAPVVALIPVTLMPSFAAALGYLFAFGLGTTMGMGVYAALAAYAVSRAGASVKLARAVAFGTAAASFAVGIWWLVTSTVDNGGRS